MIYFNTGLFADRILKIVIKSKSVTLKRNFWLNLFMLSFLRKRQVFSILILFLLSGCNSFSSEFVEIEPIGVHPNGTVYIGMESCKECHLEIVNSHSSTSHWLTSSKFVTQNFAPITQAENTSFILDDKTKIAFTAVNDSIYQQAYKPPYSTPFFSKSIDLAIGSGTKIGYSFLTWEKNSLYQLQGSFYKPNLNWINSPGYPSRFQAFRPIFPRCLECHTTFSQSENWESPAINNRYNKNNIVFGIDCQRCHGPVLDHVKYHRKNPNDKEPKNILKFTDLTQQQRLDLCALCHSGVRSNRSQPAFSFVVGDLLDDYLSPQGVGEPDVHSNQVGLLLRSKCFIESEKMDCSTCHDPHSNEKNNLVKFNNRCIECHQKVEHVTFKSDQNSDCVNCHMPYQESKIMKIQINPDSIRSVMVRTHKIDIY